MQIKKFIPRQMKSTLATILCSDICGTWIARFYSDRIPVDGLRIRTNNPHIRNVVKASLYWGIYESGERRFLKRYLTGDHDVVELGGSIGVVSCSIARQLKPGRRLVVVEADPNLAGVVKENLEENGYTDAHVVNAAIDYAHPEQQKVCFSRGKMSNGGKLATTDSPSDGLAIDRMTLAELSDKFEFDKFDLVCDIEGAEAGLLEPTSKLVDRCIMIVIELHRTTWNGREKTVNEMIDSIQNFGYQLIDSHGPVCVFRNLRLRAGKARS